MIKITQYQDFYLQSNQNKLFCNVFDMLNVIQ